MTSTQNTLELKETVDGEYEDELYNNIIERSPLVGSDLECKSKNADYGTQTDQVSDSGDSDSVSSINSTDIFLTIEQFNELYYGAIHFLFMLLYFVLHRMCVYLY